MKYDKLVRDRIPDIIRDRGTEPVIRYAAEGEYSEKLGEKLREEVSEYLESGDAEELADIMEVVHALAALSGRSPQDIEHVRAEKVSQRGGFTKRIILEEA